MPGTTWYSRICADMNFHVYSAEELSKALDRLHSIAAVASSRAGLASTAHWQVACMAV